MTGRVDQLRRRRCVPERRTGVDNDLLLFLVEVPLGIPPALRLGRALRHKEERAQSHTD